MTTTVGEGTYVYEAQDDWARIPEGWTAPMAAVAVDSQDRVYGFNRGEHAVIVFDRDGNFLHEWGGADFAFPHAIYADPADNIWIVDRNLGQVFKFTPRGELLMTIGEKGFRSDTGADNSVLTSDGYKKVTRAGGPFNLPAGIGVASSGKIFIADGYANCQVHRFSADGVHEMSWGEPGSGPGQFRLPHGAWVDSRDRVLIADRENDRVQAFTKDGEYITEWATKLIGPAVLWENNQGTVFVAEHNGGFFSILTLDGELLARWGSQSFRSCHGVAGDSEGSVYFVQPTGGEGSNGRRIVKYTRKS